MVLEFKRQSTSVAFAYAGIPVVLYWLRMDGVVALEAIEVPIDVWHCL